MPRTKHQFNNRASLNQLIDEYFERSKNDTNKHPDPVTLTGLALYLGFTNKEAFDEYEQMYKYRDSLTRARFRVMAYYESRLHHPSPSGAIFALKSMGWDHKVEAKKPNNRANSLTVKVIDTGMQPASAEKEVKL
ncbi:MAG TPA: terminase small subunit [Mucilaginibacter sp.]|jgi:hypothetical protein|nr:terminase small subunit [Mucilaginibacter sp.]